MSQQVTPYILQPKLVQQMHEFISTEVDPVLHELTEELKQDHEMKKAYLEA